MKLQDTSNLCSRVSSNQATCRLILITSTQKNSLQTSVMSQSKTSGHQQLVQQSQQQPSHMQTNTDVTSTQKNSLQTTTMSQSDFPRQQQFKQYSQHQRSDMQTNPDVTSIQKTDQYQSPSRQQHRQEPINHVQSKSVIRNTRQNRQQCNRLNVTKQSPADADKDWRNNRSNRASGQNVVHQQEIGHVSSAIGKTNYHNHPSEQHIRSRTFRRSTPPLNKQAVQMSHN